MSTYERICGEKQESDAGLLNRGAPIWPLSYSNRKSRGWFLNRGAPKWPLSNPRKRDREDWVGTLCNGPFLAKQDKDPTNKKDKDLEKGALHNGRFPLSSKIIRSLWIYSHLLRIYTGRMKVMLVEHHKMWNPCPLRILQWSLVVSCGRSDFFLRNC